MGYFNSAVVFTSQPDWKQLQDLPAKIGFRGYRHTQASLWLLDYWIGARQQPPAYPFITGDEAKLFANFEADITTNRLEQVAQHINLSYGPNWLRFALQVSRLTKQDAYFFAADDDLCDLSVTIRDGAVKRAVLDDLPFRIEAENGSLRITPLICTEDELDDSGPNGELLSRLRALPFVTVTEPVEFSGGRQLHGNAIAGWPADAGDPGTLLGLGHWNPPEDVASCLELEFERLATRAPQSQKFQTTKKRPWWQLWG